MRANNLSSLAHNVLVRRRETRGTVVTVFLKDLFAMNAFDCRTLKGDDAFHSGQKNASQSGTPEEKMVKSWQRWKNHPELMFHIEPDSFKAIVVRQG